MAKNVSGDSSVQSEASRARARKSDKTNKSARTRRRIMDAASQIMVERGNTLFHMSEISKACNMSKGALYYYFSNKRDLLRAVFVEALDDLIDVIDYESERSESAEVALRGICREYARQVRDGSPLPLAIMHALIRVREVANSGDEKRFAEIVSRISRLLEQAKQEGVVREDLDAQFAAYSVCGAFAFAAMGIGDADKAADDFASELMGLVVEGVGAK